MSTGFLVTNLMGKLKYVNELVSKHFLKKLYIYVSLNNQPNLLNTEWVSKRVVDLYSSSTSLFPNLDVRIILSELKSQEVRPFKVKDFDVDIVILPRNYSGNKVCDIENTQKKLQVFYSDDESIEEAEGSTYAVLKVYPNAVLGGTFDRFHNGHKILLSEALLRCSNKLTIGVTDENMIKGKKLYELIEPPEKRVEEIKKFIREVDSTVDYEVVIISDMYGPTKSDPNLNLLVVSSETERGATKINELRKQKNLNVLDVHVINLAEDFVKNEIEEKKVSSSNERIRLLGTYIKVPQAKHGLPCKPYRIGLTGGVASGKSSVADYLKSLGAGVIDCDKIAHQLYKPKTDIYYKLIELFGKKIVSENGEINRKELGGIVFNNPDKLQILNELLWPEILKVAERECERLYDEEKKEIVVLEAAVLLKANWSENVHEIWGTIIPENEAIVRLINRNNLTEEEAKSRIKAQTPNSEIVRCSNVILCSLWSYEFTREQVNKAWKSVQAFIENDRSEVP